MTAAPSIYVELAQRLADASGGVIRRHFRTPFAVDAKGDATPVTIADREAEAAIRAVLKAECPEHGILGEEHGSEALDAEHVWVIDPIDGTKSFITGRPIFGTLIALFRRGRPVIGIIDQPILRERWVGAAGHPTLFNGEVVRARACPRLDLATLTTTAPDLFDAVDGQAFAKLKAACRYTTYGSDCYGYALVALGFLDLVLESGLKSYDWGALVPVLEGAGAVISDWDGKAPELGVTSKILVAGDPALHAAALEAIR